MIQSTTYLDSVANGELVPQITLSPLANPDEEWTTLEMGDILMKQSNQIFGIGNHNGVSYHKLFYPFLQCRYSSDMQISKHNNDI